jgi:hypothetical protein
LDPRQEVVVPTCLHSTSPKLPWWKIILQWMHPSNNAEVHPADF